VTVDVTGVDVDVAGVDVDVAGLDVVLASATDDISNIFIIFICNSFKLL